MASQAIHFNAKVNTNIPRKFESFFSRIDVSRQRLNIREKAATKNNKEIRMMSIK